MSNKLNRYVKETRPTVRRRKTKVKKSTCVNEDASVGGCADAPTHAPA